MLTTIKATEIRPPIPLWTLKITRLGTPGFRWAVLPALLAWLAWVVIGDDALMSGWCVSRDGSFTESFVALVRVQLALFDPLRMALAWLIMLTAMMLPLIAPVINHLAGRTFADCRERAAGWFTAGYVSVWIGVMLLASLFLVTMHTVISTMRLSTLAPTICCGLAALWQGSGAKRTALRRCHRLPILATSATNADRAFLRFGLIHGYRCARACAPTMILPMVGAPGIGTMAIIFVILSAERTVARPRQTTPIVMLLLLGCTSLA